MTKKTFGKMFALGAMCLTVLMTVGHVRAGYASSVEDILVDVLKTAIGEAGKSSSQKKNAPAPTKAKDSAKDTGPAMASEMTVDVDTSGAGVRLQISIEELANRIIANNRPAFDIQLERKELPTTDFWDQPMEIEYPYYNRVWAKGKTVVIGEAGRDRKFHMCYFVTGDPEFVFVGGLHAGGSTKLIENFVGAPLSKITSKPGYVGMDPTSFVFAGVYYENETITKIMFYNAYGTLSERTWTFVRGKIKEMGLGDEMM